MSLYGFAKIRRSPGNQPKFLVKAPDQLLAQPINEKVNVDYRNNVQYKG